MNTEIKVKILESLAGETKFDCFSVGRKAGVNWHDASSYLDELSRTTKIIKVIGIGNNGQVVYGWNK